MLSALHLLACAPSPPALPTVTPSGTPPTDLPDREAWAATAPLEGVQRLFVGPFRCALPDGRVVDFHPRGIARSDDGLRGRWSHRDHTLTLETEGPAASFPYQAWSASGAWMLATPDGALACRPGHEAAPATGGTWLRVVDAGGPLTTVGKALVPLELPLVVQDGSREHEGLLLRHRPGHAPDVIAQAIADAVQQPVALSAAPTLDAPYELVVGGGVD